MLNYPLQFKAQAKASQGTDQPWEIQSDAINSQCAIPHEFGGPGGAFSPEDLFAQALTNCFVATFKVYAQTSKAAFSTIAAQSQLAVDLDESGKPVMKKLSIHAQIRGATQPERIRTLAEKAFSSGFILNSVKTELELVLDVSSS